MTDDDDSRLPTNCIPSHYELAIRTDLAQQRFSGSVKITIKVTETIPCITLHLVEPLKLNSAELTTRSGSFLFSTVKARKHSQIKLLSKKERVQLYFHGGDIPPGEHELRASFDSRLDSSMKGYYLSSYPSRHDPKATSYFAATQFQPCAARRAFPCFDEPCYKATFAVKMISRVGTVSLSNMSVESVKRLASDGSHTLAGLASLLEPAAAVADEEKGEEDEDGWVIVPVYEPALHSAEWEEVTFTLSPPMSTYLVAFANGDLEHLESSFTSTTGKVVPLRFYATHDCVKQTRMALETTAKLLPLYERIFDIPLPLSKLDTLVVNDFDLGAMENWGLITGRTSVYCYDEFSGGLNARKAIVSTTSHELSHQWFGNIVTLSWWQSLWLNEAFATLVGEILFLDRIEPLWNVHSAFIGEHLSRALNLDALRSSHPIEMPCPDEATIQQIFDAVSYSKGASVLRMLLGLLGEETFLKGVTLYLKKHLYSNARTEQLFASLSEASGREVGKLMLSWTTKIGFPVLTVTETSEGITVRQNRFLATGAPSDNEDNTIWDVPLQLLSLDADGKAGIASDTFLSSREASFDIHEGGVDGFYKLNAGTLGVYRVLYPADRLSKLAREAIRPKSNLTLNDRMGLVQDAHALCVSGHSRTSHSLSLIHTFHSHERGSLVWDEMVTALSSLSATWWEQDQSVQDALSRLNRDVIKDTVDRLGWRERSGESQDDKELRWTAIAFAAGADDAEVLKEYNARFKPLLDDDNDSEIPADLRTSIFRTCVRKGGIREWEKVQAVYRKPATPAHKRSAIAALAQARQPELIKRTLDFVMSSEVKTQDLNAFVSSLATNPAARRPLWDRFKVEYTALVERLSGNFQIGGVVKACFSSLSSLADAEAVETFFADKETSLYNQALQQGIESIRTKAAWLQRDDKDVREWLRQKQYLR